MGGVGGSGIVGWNDEGGRDHVGEEGGRSSGGRGVAVAVAVASELRSRLRVQLPQSWACIDIDDAGSCAACAMR